ncbi:sensor histidine kinase [Aureimonas sp. N4]|uniref:sensor histidine kinase n=1 Tax=Aureimonas sp. N4 TaxID=1638165 RepID=UPI0007810708|nr:sensor histidine kinase [Aureimonas sp. N4]
MRRLSRVTVGAVATGFALLVIAGGATTWLIARVADNTALVSHSLRVELGLSQFRTLSEQAETARRGFLLDPDARFARAVEGIAGNMGPALEDLRAMVRDNADQSHLLDRLAAASREHLILIRRSMAQRRTETSPSGLDFSWDRSTQLIQQVRELAGTLTEEERQLLDERIERQQASQRIAYGVIALAAVLLMLVAAGTIWVTRSTLRALHRTSGELARLNDDLEGAVQARTVDLQRANDEIQRFAYIVSHDLRSPLVNVMGFTSEMEATIRPLSELVERAEAEGFPLSEDAKLAVREDLPESIRFIRASTEKMDRLINAILRLSREGRRNLAPEPIDMNALVAGIVGSSQHKLQDVGGEVRVSPLPSLVSDRVGLEQIFSNLIENSIKYRKPGRPPVIEIRGRREGERALFEVADNGRGIDPKDHDRVFDLFRRSGAQDQPGEGIGLAHVRAMVYRLGGIISCESTLDAGATFCLSMRADLSDEGARAS